MSKPEIVSIVGGGSIGREIDLEALSDAIEGQIVSYDPSNWHGLRLRFENTSPSILMFRSGKYNVAGAVSSQQLYQARDEFLNRLNVLGISASDTSFEIYNYVILSDFKREIDLEKALITLGLNNTEYEPEQFSGLLYKPDNSDDTFLIFNSGKVLLTGVRNAENIEERFIELDNQLTL